MYGKGYNCDLGYSEKVNVDMWVRKNLRVENFGFGEYAKGYKYNLGVGRQSKY